MLVFRTPSKFTRVLLAALALFVLSNRTDASPPQTPFEYGLLQQMSDDFGDAATSFTKAISLNPKDADAYRQRGRCYMQLKDFEKAKTDLDHAIKLNPSDYTAHAVRGYWLLQHNQIKEGLAECLQAHKLEHPDEYNFGIPGNFENIGKALRLLGREQECAPFVTRAKNLRLVGRALDFRENRRPDDAITACNMAIKNDPTEVCAYYVRGIVLLNTSHNSEAIQEFSTCLRLCPAFIPPRYFRADAYMQLNQPAKAVEDYTRLLQVPNRFIASKQTAETGRQREHFTGRDEEIISKADIYYLRAKAWTELKQFKSAIADYDQSAKLAPNDPEPANRKAELLASTGETLRAEKSLSISSKINEKDWKVLSAQAQLFEQQKLYTQALEVYSKMIAQFPNQAGAYFLRARLNEKLNNYRAAVIDYTKMVGLEGHDDDAYRCRADCYMKLGDYRRAESDYSTAMKLDPKNASLISLKKEAEHKNSNRLPPGKLQ